jgi:nucleotide-binding universal stress UspA family protein
MTYRKILVPVDGSEPSKRALDEALRLAKVLGSKLRLLHVVEEHILALTPEAGMLSAQLLEALQLAGDELLRDTQAQAKKNGIEADTVKVESLGGRVSEIIAEQAKDWPADLIVMGTHGRRGLPHLVLGSDAERVARSAPVPLLLVRPQH